MPPRDRDEAGRALNSRPRDGLGRPLPHGTDGVPRVPEDASFTPDEALDAAQRFLDDGLPFHAHEVLESVWKSAAPEDRWLWRGLAQLAVGLTHLRRGNPSGAVALLQRGRDGIDQSDAPFRVDVSGLVARVDGLIDDVRGGRPVEPERLSLRLRR